MHWLSSNCKCLELQEENWKMSQTPEEAGVPLKSEDQGGQCQLKVLPSLFSQHTSYLVPLGPLWSQLCCSVAELRPTLENSTHALEIYPLHACAHTHTFWQSKTGHFENLDFLASRNHLGVYIALSTTLFPGHISLPFLFQSYSSPYPTV